jgi:hypothetical protein
MSTAAAIIPNSQTSGQTRYASLNLVWQVRKRLSLGLEGLYGFKEKSGADGDAFRIQIGAVYSIFD